MERLPSWLRQVSHRDLRTTKRLLRRHSLSTVCESARCPNKGHCFSKPTATFLILGDRCTRNCGFCSVKNGIPRVLDDEEPRRVATAAVEMALRHVVITSVTRDDLPDGGAGQFARTIEAVRGVLPEAAIEVLTPDFKGDLGALHSVLSARPDVFNHNIETVPSLYETVRPGADYLRSLKILNAASSYSGIKIKSGLMLGLGEGMEEVNAVLRDLYSAGCRYLTIGQYLRPTRHSLSVKEYIHPEIFDEYRLKALEIGYLKVASAPFVRSSMDAEEMTC